MSINLLKRKPRDKPAAYSRPAKQQRKNAEDTPRTSARSPECSTSRQNLTLSDWMTVYSFVDTHFDPAAWKIVRTFATTPMSLPDAEKNLQTHLGERYMHSDWRPALKAVMDAEGDAEMALNAID